MDSKHTGTHHALHFSDAFRDRYQNLRFINSGGMGSVYEALDTKRRIRVAIKFLAPELIHSATQIQSFHREFLAAAELRHPGIVQVYDFGESTGTYYFTMEYVEGGTLRDLLRSPETGWTKEMLLAEERLDRILRALIDTLHALNYIHYQHFIHRDLKPENIMLPNSGGAKICDFGLVIDQDLLLTASHDFVGGTPVYMSPEAFLNERLDVRSDLYSFGIVFYEALTGYRPFHSKKYLDLMEEKLHGELDPVHLTIPELAGEVSTFLMDLTHRHRYRRPASALEAYYRLREKILPRLPISKASLKDLTSAAQALETIQSQVFQPRFIGQIRVIEQARMEVARVENHEVRSLCIEGAPGCGKSRFLSEFLHSMRVRGSLILELKADGVQGRYRDLEPLFVQVFPSPVITQNELEEKDLDIAALIASNWFPAVQDKFVWLKRPLMPELEQEAIEKLLIQLFEFFVRKVRKNRILCIAIDDFHRLHPDSRHLLLQLRERAARSKSTGHDQSGWLMVITHTRQSLEARGIASEGSDDRVPASITDTVLTLEPLAEGETGTMVESALGIPMPVSNFSAAVHDYCGGNPNLVYHLLLSLVESGLLKRQREGWLVSGTTELQNVTQKHLPDILPGFSLTGTLSNLLEDRFKRLTRKEREVLRVAALAPGLASYSLLTTVTGITKTDLHRTLRSLIRSEFLADSADQLADICFPQPLRKEWVIGNIPQTELRQYHRKIVEHWLPKSDLQFVAERLFPHACQGEKWREALKLGSVAAQEALDRHDCPVAEEIARKVIEIRDRLHLDPSPQPMEMVLGQAITGQGRFEEAKTYYSRMVDRSWPLEIQAHFNLQLALNVSYLQEHETAGTMLKEFLNSHPVESFPASLLGDFYVLLSEECRETGNNPECRAWAEKALQAISERSDPDIAVRAHGLIGNTYLIDGRHDLTEYHLDVAHRISGGNLKSSRHLLIDNSYAALRYKQGRYEEALEICERVFHESRRLSYIQGIHLGYNNLIQILMTTSNYRESEEMGEQFLTWTRDLGNHTWEQNALTQLGSLYLQWEKYKEAEHYLLQALKINPKPMGIRLQLAVVWSYCNQSERAIALLEELLTEAQQCADTQLLERIYVSLGDIYIRCFKDVAMARECLDKMQKCVKQRNTSLNLLFENKVEACILLAEGKAEEAVSLLQATLFEAEQRGQRGWTGLILQLLAEANRRLGSISEAQDYINRSITIFQDLELAHNLSNSFEIATKIYTQLLDYDI